VKSSKLKEFAKFLIGVEKCGGEFQRRQNEHYDWHNYTKDNGPELLSWEEFELGDLRIKPKEEEKKKIPLELCDIAPSTIFKGRGWDDGHFSNLLSATNEGVYFFIKVALDKFEVNTYSNLLEYGWKYSIDQGKTWKGCWKYDR